MDEQARLVAIDPELILNVLAAVVVAVDRQTVILYVNNAGEQFFQSSAANLRGQRLDHLVPADSPLFALI